jgi:hypothetical protein
MSFPGGPGAIPCAENVIEIQRPLASVPGANRGATKELHASDALATNRLARTVRPVVDARSLMAGCVVAEALVITLGRKPLRLTAGPATPPEIAGLIMPRIRAQVKWGVGGSAALEALVDWQHGTQITISAEYVEISAIYDVVTEPWDPATLDPCDLPSYDVAAGVGYGSISVNSNPARLTEIVQLQTPASAPVDISIPPFATSFTVYTMGGTEEATIQQLAFGVGFNTTHVFGPGTDPTQYLVENAIPIWNGAELLRVTNTSDSGPLHAFIVFGLALG